ncbi:putative CENPB DNA-binding domain-containing protein 1 [Octopus bimaculoides]|uniref:putative CENPB DNA-binding domain-containing protein 1 n=1 Tax=Octopus bimaculoides TaxID=37653 RepID=UPI00071D9A82|nr:putative CENPB DNA-binding domain-containing protein 1 [Octopus bimaculoides]|eukprot:XP_014791253.1 PREDICTED: CENPB DNA-binding domain-containing protein 1-like [Octopus bimaculoides]
MTGKRKMFSSTDAPSKKSRKAIDLDCKMKIIRQYEGGKKVNTIAHDLKLLHSTVSTILKDKGRICEAVKGSAPLKSTILAKQRQGPIHEMDKLLFMWMEDLIQKKKTPMNFLTVQTKARSLFQTLKSRSGDNYAQYFQEKQEVQMKMEPKKCVDSFDELMEEKGYLRETNIQRR